MTSVATYDGTITRRRSWAKRLRRLFDERLKIALMLAPLLLIILGLFVGSGVFVVGQSLGYLPVIGKYDFTLEAYDRLIHDPDVWWSLLVSFHIAFTSTVISTALAIVCALILRETFLGKKAISFLFQLSLSIPHIVVVLAVLLLVSQGGLLARLAYHAGAISEPREFPALVFDRLQIGIILVYILKEVPFIGIIVLAILQGIGREYEETAATMGATPWQRFRYVILPMIGPGTLSAFIIVFAYVFGAFEIPYLLGRTYPASTPVLGLRYYLNVDLGARPVAMALNVLILVFILVLTGLYMRISRTYLRKDR